MPTAISASRSRRTKPRLHPTSPPASTGEPKGRWCEHTGMLNHSAEVQD